MLFRSGLGRTAPSPDPRPLGRSGTAGGRSERLSTLRPQRHRSACRLHRRTGRPNRRNWRLQRRNGCRLLSGRRRPGRREAPCFTMAVHWPNAKSESEQCAVPVDECFYSRQPRLRRQHGNIHRRGNALSPLGRLVWRRRHLGRMSGRLLWAERLAIVRFNHRLRRGIHGGYLWSRRADRPLAGPPVRGRPLVSRVSARSSSLTT